MRDRLASLIVVKQEGGNNDTNNNNNDTHQDLPASMLLQPPIKCEASLYALSPYESSLYHEINNNSCYRQNLNNQQQTQQQPHHHQHQHQLLPPPLPPLIYPCRNLFPDGCDITHLACCSSSSTSTSTSSSSSSCSPTSNTNTSSGTATSSFYANGNTCMYWFLSFLYGAGFLFLFFANRAYAISRIRIAPYEQKRSANGLLNPNAFWGHVPNGGLGAPLPACRKGMGRGTTTHNDDINFHQQCFEMHHKKTW